MLFTCDAMETEAERSLWNAAGEGQLGEVRRIIGRGVNVNWSFSEGLTALHFAVLQGNMDIVVCLVQRGANVDQATNTGITPLMSACSQGLTEIAKFLVQSGANVNAVNQDGDSILLYLGKARLSKARISRGRGSLHGFYKRCHSEVQCNCMDLVKLLVRSGVNVNHQDDENNTALMTFIISRHDMIAMYLLQAGADATVVSSEGHTALFLVCQRGLSFELVPNLIACGAEVNQAKQPEGTTPLMSACLNCATNAMTLIEAGADVNATSDKGETALRFALLGSGSDLINLLLDEGARIDKELVLAVIIGHKVNIQTLATRCLFPNVVGSLHSLLFDFEYLSKRFGIPVAHYFNHPLIAHLEAIGITSITPFMIALMSNRDLILRYFIKNLFLHPLDMCLIQDYWKLKRTLQDDTLSLELTPLTSQPWSLNKLSFMSVSSLMGFDIKREERVKASGLPDSVQRKLLYRDHSAFQSPSKWSEFQIAV